MKLATMLGIAAITLAMVGQSAIGQDGAAAKAKGTAYNFWRSMGWQQQAHSQARALYYYGQTVQPTHTQAREHATAARQGVEKALQSLAGLKKDHEDNQDVLTAITRIEAIQKKVLGHCDMMDKALAKGDHVEMCACCADVVHEIEAANAEMSKLQKLLKIENPELPKR